MDTWKKIKGRFVKIVEDVAKAAEAPFVPEGDPNEYEERHQAVYDHVTGTESFQPVMVKKEHVSVTPGEAQPGAMH